MKNKQTSELGIIIINTIYYILFLYLLCIIYLFFGPLAQIRRHEY